MSAHRIRTTTHKLCHEGQLSLVYFLATIGLVLLPSVPQIYFGIIPNICGAVLWGPILYYAVFNLILRYNFARRNEEYQIIIRASFLGFVEAISTLLILFAPSIWKQFGVYGFFMGFFHYTEYLSIAWCNPRSLTTDSFILNHSIHYALAAVASWMEFILEIYLLPSFKDKYYIWTIGVLLCTAGEIVRKLAMITASSSFTHLVQYEKDDDHVLVTHGIYGYVRHPSYAGWFWWSIGTQIILFNPVCIVVYTLVSWKFFHDRIFMEEFMLLRFFQSEYKNYQQRVPSGLPFIKGL